jgi:chromosome segregation ATPase
LNLRSSQQELLNQIETLKRTMDSKNSEIEQANIEIKRLKEEKQLSGIILTKFKTIDQNFSDLLRDHDNLQRIIDFKSKELIEVNKLKDTLETNCKLNDEKIKLLNEEKQTVESKLKEHSVKLNGLIMENDNCTKMIQQSYKVNALLKEEKEHLNRVLHDNVNKFKELKKEYDDLLKKYDLKEKDLRDLKIDFDLENKKLNQLVDTNDKLTKDKDDLMKELKHSRFEVSNLKESNQTLNKKFMITIAEKDTQISQLQQSLMCK